MATNELRMGEPRLCHLIDGNPDTPESVVMLRNTGDAIEAMVPISGVLEGYDGPYDRWWSPPSLVEFGDDPDRTKYSYSPPPVMMVYDDSGPVVLVGCHATGGANQTHIAGKGVLVVDYAVLGGRKLNYRTVNGMRTTSPAYRKWVGKSSIDISEEKGEAGCHESLSLALKRADSMKILRRLNMSARHDSIVRRAHDGYDVREFMTFQTLVKRPQSWFEHLDLHVGILDLVSIAAWKNCAFQAIHVNREDDPMRTIDGDKVDEQWHEVVSHKLPGADLTDCDGHFLFSYNDMAQGAIYRWFRLRREYGRALDYLLRILRSGHTWSPQSAIMSGIALEQLGYLIDKHENNGSRLKSNKREQLSFKSALDVILDGMKALPFEKGEIEGWKERCRNVYMGAKHADREEVDHLTMLNTHRENLLVLRYWIAQRLGVSGKVLCSNLNLDPLYVRFEPAPGTI